MNQAGVAAMPSRWGDLAPVVNRYLAARLFASWVPYKSNRLLALIDDLERAHAILAEAVANATLVDALRCRPPDRARPMVD